MFNIAQEALLKNSDLKKVVIMEHPPMFDNTLKSQLADLANSTLSQLWAISPVRSKIFIGRHSLVSPGSGSMHLARFKDYYSGKYDGIHLYGRTGERDYTDSVKSILLLALSDQHPNLVNNETEIDTKFSTTDHTKCKQAQYQWRQVQKRRTNSHTNNSAQFRYDTHSQHSQHTRAGLPQWSVPTENRFSFLNQGN